MHERNIVVTAEQRHHILGLAEPQQPVIDEHARELLADGLMNENRGDGGIDAAGQPADHPALADLAADLLDGLVFERAHRPVAGAARDLAHEIAQDGGAVRRVHDLEMELRGVELARLVGDHRDRRVGRRGYHLEALGRRSDAIAVAHPHRIFLADLPDAVEQRRRVGDFDFGAAEFAMVSGLDLAAELLRHRLLAVANAENGHARVIDRLRREWCVAIEHRGRTAGQDDAFRLHLAEGAFRFLERHDFAIDFFLAHPPRDELGDLRAEIDDENLVVGLRSFLQILRHSGF